MRRVVFTCLAACLLNTGAAWAQNDAAGLTMPPTDILPRPGLSRANDDTDAGKRPELFMPLATQDSAASEPQPLTSGETGFTPLPLAAPESAGPARTEPMPVPAPQPQAAEIVPSCRNDAADCLQDQDGALRKQLETKRLAELKTMRDGGSYSANRARTRNFVSMGMSDDARRELTCDKARKLADDSDKDGEAAWFACDIAGLQAALSGTGPIMGGGDAAPMPIAPIEAVTAETAN